MDNARNLKGKPLQFKVKYAFQLPGEERAHTGIAELSNYYMIDQRGLMYESSPGRPIGVCPNSYTELTPLIKIGDEFLSIEEIEGKIELYNTWQYHLNNPAPSDLSEAVPSKEYQDNKPETDYEDDE